MFDPLDHIEDGRTVQRSRSMLRNMFARASIRRKLVDLCKLVLYEYLNSEKSIDQVVDEWMREHPNYF